MDTSLLIITTPILLSVLFYQIGKKINTSLSTKEDSFLHPVEFFGIGLLACLTVFMAFSIIFITLDWITYFLVGTSILNNP